MAENERLERLNKRSGFNMHNGIKVTELNDEICVVEGELKPESLNPWGSAHGGFVYSLCDVAAGVAGSKGRKCVTQSGSIYYLRPGVGTKLRAEGKVIKNGKRVVLVETNVFSEDGTHVARGEFQIFITE